MSRYKKILGNSGEEKALYFLRQKGYTVRERNWRCPLGEIDLIVEKGGLLVFVEVKTRSDDAFGSAAEAVQRKKQGRISRAAAAYIQSAGLKDRNIRYDVVAVLPDSIDHIENAFTAEGFTL